MSQQVVPRTTSAILRIRTAARRFLTPSELFPVRLFSIYSDFIRPKLPRHDAKLIRNRSRAKQKVSDKGR
jgi:hypothetical protein